MDKTLSVSVSVIKKHTSTQFPEKENTFAGNREHKLLQTLSDTQLSDRISSLKNRSSSLQGSYDIQRSISDINKLHDDELADFCRKHDCAIFQVCITELTINDQEMMKLKSTDSDSLIVTTNVMGVEFNSLPVKISAGPVFNTKQNYLIIDYRKFFNTVTTDVFSIQLIKLNGCESKPIAGGKLKFDDIAAFPRTQVFSFIQLSPIYQKSERQEQYFGMLMYWYRLIGDIEIISTYSQSNNTFPHDLENNSNYKATLEENKLNMAEILDFKTTASQFLNAATGKKFEDESLANAKLKPFQIESNKINKKPFPTQTKSISGTDKAYLERNLSPLTENSLFESQSIQQEFTPIQQSPLLPKKTDQSRKIENKPTQNAETQSVSMYDVCCQTSLKMQPALPTCETLSSHQLVNDESKLPLRYDKSYEKEKSSKAANDFHRRTLKSSSVSFSLIPDKRPERGYSSTKFMSPNFNPKVQYAKSLTDSEPGNQVVKNIESLLHVTNPDESVAAKRSSFWHPKKSDPGLSTTELSVIDISRYQYLESDESIKNDVSQMSQNDTISSNKLSKAEVVSSHTLDSTDLSQITNPQEKFPVDPNTSDVTAFSKALGLVLARNNALDVKQSEISEELDSRTQWLHEESDWRRTLQEYAILQGDDPTKVPWRQWRDNKTVALKPRKYLLQDQDVHLELNITIHSLEFKKEAAIFKNSKMKQVYIEYSFLTHHGEQMETPFSLPLPKIQDLKPIVFEFTKIFFFDPTRNRQDRSLLADLVKTKQNIRFIIVNEPMDDESGSKDCEEIGYVDVNVFDLAQCENDIIREDFPIKDVTNEMKIIGNLNISFINVKSIRRVALEVLSPPGFKVR